MYGRTLLSSTGNVVRVSADGRPELKAGGVTIDWNTVAAAGADTVLADGTNIKAGQKFLRFGQVLTRILLTGNDSLSIDATGGTFTLTVTIGGTGVTTGAIAYNANAATIQTALQGLSNVGTNNATVTGSGPFTIAFDNSLGAVTLTAGSGSLTGNTHTATVTANAPGGDFNFFGPYDPAATDGRQTLSRGDCFVCDTTILQYGSGSSLLSSQKDQAGGMIEGGSLWKSRIIMTTGSHSLANGPTVSEFETAFPRVSYFKN